MVIQGFSIDLLPAPLHAGQSRNIKVSGVGGENFRKFYSGSGSSYLSRIQKMLPDTLRSYALGVKELLASSFDEFGIDQEAPDGMIKHYRKLRSRIIGGRGFYENKKYTFLSPLFDSDLIHLSDKYGVADKELYRDIMMLGGGEELIGFDYDRPEKKFDHDFVRRSPFFRNKKYAYKEGWKLYSVKCSFKEKKMSGEKGGSLHYRISREVDNMIAGRELANIIPEDIYLHVRSMHGADDPKVRKFNNCAIHSALISYSTVRF